VPLADGSVSDLLSADAPVTELRLETP